MRDKIEVTVTYTAEVTSTVSVPKEWDIEKIRKELEGGVSYYMDREDEDYVKCKSISELIVNGYVIDLETNKEIK